MSNQLGQLFFTGIKSTSLDDEEKKFLEQANIGGVFLRDKNIESPAQLAELVNSIQVLRDEYPLFIAVDWNGGESNRGMKGFTSIPAIKELVKLGSPKNVFEVFSIISTELSVCGVNVNFSPCCDVLTQDNPFISEISFGSDPQEVEKFVSASIRGMQTNSIVACAKYFPGYGNSVKDPRNDIPYDDSSIVDFEVRLKPYIKAAKSRVEMMMIGHVQLDCFDDQNISTMSPKLNQYLRDKLKFNRILISDILDNNSISSKFNVEEVLTKTISSGIDILLFKDFSNCKTHYEKMRELQKTKKVSNDLLEPKYERILNCKKKFFSEYKPVYIPNIKDQVNTAKSQNFIKDILELINQS